MFCGKEGARGGRGGTWEILSNNVLYNCCQQVSWPREGLWEILAIMSVVYVTMTTKWYCNFTPKWLQDHATSEKVKIIFWGGGGGWHAPRSP